MEGFERYKKMRIWERYVLVVSVRGFEDLRQGGGNRVELKETTLRLNCLVGPPKHNLA